jgi:hypothetical protein
MKALVFGAYPPMPGPEAAATLDTVRGLLAEGVDVEVVSPEPSGAHRYADVRRLTGAVRLAGWVAAAERVVLHLDPGTVLGWLDGRKVPPGRLALGLALRRPAQVRVELGPIRGRLDDRSVRAVLGRADRVVAASRFDRDILLAAGLPSGTVEVASAAEPEPQLVEEVVPAPVPVAGEPAPVSDPGPWRLGPEPDRDEIQAEIRRRAAVRAAGGGREAAGAVPRTGPQANLPGTAASRPLLAISPLGPAMARSPKPVVGLVKRAVRKLVGWQVDPVIEHVNRLHRATLEAIETQERGRAD